MRMPREPGLIVRDRLPRKVTWPIVFAALSSGALCAAVASAVIGMGPMLAGIVTTMPMIGVVSVALQHAAGGSAAVTPYLRGYIASSMCRAAFCTVVAVCAVPLGTPAAMTVALVLSLGALAWANGTSTGARS